MSEGIATRLARYDGKTEWEAFHAPMELFAQAGKWTIEVKDWQCALVVTSPSNLPLLNPDDRSDCGALVGALKRRFRQCLAASLLHSELCSRQRRPGEPLRDLANGWPTAPHLCPHALSNPE